MQHYIETYNPFVNKKQIEMKNSFIKIDSLNIELSANFTCPLQCMVLYAHDLDIDYT